MSRNSFISIAFQQVFFCFYFERLFKFYEWKFIYEWNLIIEQRKKITIHVTSTKFFLMSRDNNQLYVSYLRAILVRKILINFFFAKIFYLSRSQFFFLQFFVFCFIERHELVDKMSSYLICQVHFVISLTRFLSTTSFTIATKNSWMKVSTIWTSRRYDEIRKM